MPVSHPLKLLDVIRNYWKRNFLKRNPLSLKQRETPPVEWLCLGQAAKDWNWLSTWEGVLAEGGSSSGPWTAPQGTSGARFLRGTQGV